MKLKYIINIHKGLTFFVVLGMILVFQQFKNPTAWVYLGLHGSYGILWNIKSRVYPDRKWEQTTTWWFVIISLLSLSLYWVAPWLLMSRGIQAPGWLLAICILFFIVGVIFHYGADMQKFTALKYKPEHLIMDGFWRFTRSPNYFGELLIFSSLAILALHWLPVIVVFIWVMFYWIPNMKKKDQSLSRYAEFSKYKSHTWLFIPFIY